MQCRSRRDAFSAAVVQAVSDMTYVLFLLAFFGAWFLEKNYRTFTVYSALNVYLLPVLCPFSGPPPSTLRFKYRRIKPLVVLVA